MGGETMKKLPAMLLGAVDAARDMRRAVSATRQTIARIL